MGEVITLLISFFSQGAGVLDNLIMGLGPRLKTLSVTKIKMSFYSGYKKVALSLREFLEAKACNEHHQDWTLRQPGY